MIPRPRILLIRQAPHRALQIIYCPLTLLASRSGKYFQTIPVSQEMHNFLNQVYRFHYGLLSSSDPNLVQGRISAFPASNNHYRSRTTTTSSSAADALLFDDIHPNYQELHPVLTPISSSGLAPLQPLQPQFQLPYIATTNVNASGAVPTLTQPTSHVAPLKPLPATSHAGSGSAYMFPSVPHTYFQPEPAWSLASFPTAPTTSLFSPHSHPYQPLTAPAVAQNDKTQG